MTRTIDRDLLRRLQSQLSSRILGQSEALKVVADWVCCWLAGLLEKAPRILLLGPTGVGKTECAVALSDAISGTCPARIDMSEFQLQESVPLLLGGGRGDPGRIRAVLTGMQSPLLLLDEIEKAHPRVLDLLLQMLEPGHITTNDGRRLDLTPVPIVCTSNLATAAVAEVDTISPSALEEHILAQVRKHLRQEILNRFDAVVVFQPLDLDAQNDIVRYQLQVYLTWLQSKGYQLVASEEVERFLLLRGFDRTWGARPLRRAIRYHVGTAVVAALIREGSGSGFIRVNGTQLAIGDFPQ